MTKICTLSFGPPRNAPRSSKASVECLACLQHKLLSKYDPGISLGRWVSYIVDHPPPCRKFAQSVTGFLQRAVVNMGRKNELIFEMFCVRKPIRRRQSVAGFKGISRGFHDAQSRTNFIQYTSFALLSAHVGRQSDHGLVHKVCADTVCLRYRLGLPALWGCFMMKSVPGRV